MKKKLKRKGFEAGGSSLPILTNNYVAHNIMSGKPEPIQLGKSLVAGYKKGGKIKLEPEDNDHEIPEDFDDNDTLHGLDPDTLRKHLGFKKGGKATAPNYKKGGKALPNYKDGGLSKKKFIARGCGKVMQNRRKITKVY